MNLNCRVCPYCGGTDVEVVETRVHPIDDILYRRRQCKKCKRTYNTAELPIGKGYMLVRKAVENL